MGPRNAGSSDLTQEKRENKSGEAAKSKALQIHTLPDHGGGW